MPPEQCCRMKGQKSPFMSKMPLIRFKTARRYDVGKIRAAVLEALPKGEREVRPGDASPPLPPARRRIGWVWKRAAA